MARSFFVGVSFLLMGGLPLQAASSWSGAPLNYKPVTADRADASLQEIRSLALTGHLTVDDIMKAAEQIKAVQPTADPPDAVAPAEAVPSEPFYTRAGTKLQIPVDDSSAPLGALGHSQLNQTLDRFPLRHLFLVKKIQIAAPMSDPDRGQLLVRTQGGRLTVYGTNDLPEALNEGVAALMYESLQGSPLGMEWRAHGDFTDFLQAYAAWMENTPQAFDNARQSEQAPEELSKLFFVASLFTDDSQNRITAYNPAPQELAWQVRQGHYGFGPFTFEVYRNQIVHLARNGIVLSASAGDVPTLWTRQGLGN